MASIAKLGSTLVVKQVKAPYFTLSSAWPKPPTPVLEEGFSHASSMPSRCSVFPAAFLAGLALQRRSRRESQRDGGRCQRTAKKKRRASAFDPIVEYKRVQDDPIGSWGFLEEDEFTKNIVSFAAVAFVPSLLLSVAVFPPSDEDGIFLPNMVAAFSYGLGLSMAVTLVLLLRISSFVDPLNKNLKATSYVVEDSRSQRSLAGDGGYYSERRKKTNDEIQRDQLLGEYQTGPAMGRLRKYLLGAAFLSALGWIVGGTSGGEMSLREDEDEEGKCGTRCIPGLMTDDSNIEMNAYTLFR